MSATPHPPGASRRAAADCGAARGGAEPTTCAALLPVSGLPAREARALLASVLQVPRETLVAHPQRPVAAALAARFAALAARRRAGEPLAYLLGVREFYGREFAVSPAVLVPRPETELLVDLSLQALAGAAAPSVLDLGTGSGCIAITLALERPDAQVLGVDRSTAALALAARNARALGARVAFAASDWYAALRGRFDLIVANPPYVAADDPHLAALAHEPALALTDGADGLACLRAVVRGAQAHLADGGWLIVEHGYDQAAAVRTLFAAEGFAAIETRHDAAGLDRACRGQRP